MKPGNPRSCRQLLAFSLIGGLAGVSAVFLFFSIQPGWQKLALPQKASRIIRYDAFDAIYIQTQSNDIFVCRFSATCERLDLDFEISNESNYPCNRKTFPTPKPPGNVVAQYKYHPCSVDSAIQDDFVILDDGSIWHWDKSESKFDGYFLGCFAIAAGCAGMLISMTLASLWTEKRDKGQISTNEAG